MKYIYWSKGMRCWEVVLRPHGYAGKKVRRYFRCLGQAIKYRDAAVPLYYVGPKDAEAQIAQHLLSMLPRGDAIRQLAKLKPELVPHFFEFDAATRTYSCPARPHLIGALSPDGSELVVGAGMPKRRVRSFRLDWPQSPAPATDPNSPEVVLKL